jgi:hypothetical protein
MRLKSLLTGKEPRAFAGTAHGDRQTQWHRREPAPRDGLARQAAAVEPRIFIRGNPGRPGDPVKRQFISFMTGDNPQPYTKGSGRLELAQSITDE